MAAKDLQIKKLADNIRFGNQSKQQNDDENTNEDILKNKTWVFSVKLH